MSRKNLLHLFLFPGNKRLRLYVLLLVAQVFIYTLIIHLLIPVLEGVQITLLDSLFFVLETMTTVGYDLVLFFPIENPLTVVLVILIIVTGVTTVLLIIPAVLAPYIQEYIVPEPPTEIPGSLSGHVVIVGYTELTVALIESLMITDLKVIMVEGDKAKALAAMQRFRRKVPVIYGDLSGSSVWKEAMVAEAQHIIIDQYEAPSATIILGMRDATTAPILSVVDDLAYKRYLRYAGATNVLSAKYFTGRILARHVFVTPDADTVYEFMQMVPLQGGDAEERLRLINVPVMEGCECIGKKVSSLQLLEKYGIELIYLWKEGHLISPEDDSIQVDASTMLFLFGSVKSLRHFFEEEMATEDVGERFAVIAGNGDVGRVASGELEAFGVPSVTVDKKPETEAMVTGDATQESILKEAGLMEARFCIVSTGNDIDNIFITLIARNLNPDLRILARANDSEAIDKLYRAGADYVAFLPTLGGQIIASIVLAETVQVLMNLPDGRMVVLRHRIKEGEITVGEIEEATEVRIVGIQSRDHTRVRPGSDEPVVQGDGVIAVGTLSTLKDFVSKL